MDNNTKSLKKIGILYICTGRYAIFWKNFYTSCEQYLLAAGGYEKHYFVFTDKPHMPFEENERVNISFQRHMPWPYPTLYRFKIFQQARQQLEEMDYIYFFNANALFVTPIGADLLPTPERPLVVVKHPILFDKPRTAFTYDTNSQSLACVSPDEGTHYFMGSVNGGMRDAYLALIDELEKRTNIDEKKGVIARWHDESHLNRYAIDHPEKLTVLEAAYAYPEECTLAFEPKILLRDKARYGGHAFIRMDKKFYNPFHLLKGLHRQGKKILKRRLSS